MKIPTKKNPINVLEQYPKSNTKRAILFYFYAIITIKKADLTIIPVNIKIIVEFWYAMLLLWIVPCGNTI